jgi:hypothetical protein
MSVKVIKLFIICLLTFIIDPICVILSILETNAEEIILKRKTP